MGDLLDYIDDVLRALMQLFSVCFIVAILILLIPLWIVGLVTHRVFKYFR